VSLKALVVKILIAKALFFPTVQVHIAKLKTLRSFEYEICIL